MNKIKKFLPTIIGGIAYLVLSVLLLAGDKSDINLYTFLGITIATPAVIALIDGLITGSLNKNFKKNMLNILATTVLMGIIMIGVTFFIKNTIGMDVLVKNTPTEGGLTFSVSEDITIGALIQPVCIILVFNAIGGFLGTKISSIFSRLRS